MPEMNDLFADHAVLELPPGMLLRRGFAAPERQKQLVAALNRVLEAAPPLQNRTKAGLTSALLTNCGSVGWWSDAKGYRYTPESPATGRPWPPMPEEFQGIVRDVLAGTAWADFSPDACLINFYGPGAKMGLHPDKDERDFTQPIVTVSLGDAADFMLGGFKRDDAPMVLKLGSGDVLAMGGESRMRFHGIRKVHPGTSPIAGLNGRYSLTFRKAL